MDLRTLVDRLYYSNRKEYSVRNGNVAYLDGKSLARPLTLPGAQRAIAIVIIVIGVIIGLLFLNGTVLDSMRRSAATEQQITENLQRQSSLETVPLVYELMTLSNDEIKTKLTDAGNTLFDGSASSDAHDLVLYKTPGDMSAADVGFMYAEGIGTLDATDATKLLNGSWSLSVDRVNGTSMVVRYADFSTGDPQIAIQNAVAKEGFAATSITDSGQDEAGNTYSMGTVDYNGTTYSWKISALPLSDMYAVSGMPENACYVGIRITA